MSKHKDRQRGFSRRKFMQIRRREHRRGGERHDDRRAGTGQGEDAASRRRRDPAKRQDPHDGCERLRSLLRSRSRMAASWRSSAGARTSAPAARPGWSTCGPHRRAGHHRQPQPPGADGQPPRLPHASRERAFASPRRWRSTPRASAKCLPVPGSPRSAASIPITSTPIRPIRWRPADRRLETELDSVAPNNPVFLRSALAGRRPPIARAAHFPGEGIAVGATGDAG